MRDFQLPGRGPVFAANAMAATSTPEATLAALDVLRAGGNAVDAAIAACAVQCVVEPESTGIGGDCFCLYAPAGTGEVIALDGAGRAPAATGIEWFEAQGITALDPISAHSVTIPGALSAWETLLAAHGRKGLDELLQPAIRLAEEGWRVQPRVAFDFAYFEAKLRRAGATSLLPGGKVPQAGDLIRNPALAETLRAVARGGARAFYEGAVAADMVAALRARGGLHTVQDFADGLSAAEFVAPIRRAFRAHEVVQCPPSGQGLITLMILGILEGLGPALDGPMGAIRFHRHIEAARLAYNDRDAFLADPRQTEVPVARLLDPAYLARLRALIDDTRALRALPKAGDAVVPPHKDTVYLCVVDRDGNACSFINSLFEGFGSAIVAEGSGVLLHNRGFGFRLQRGHPNCIAPRKRPMHTIIPGMLMQDGKAVMPFGVMGGHFQPMGQSLFLTNLLDYGLDVQAAIDLPRLFPRLGAIEAERGIDAALSDRLSRLGHIVRQIDRPHGGAQAIWIDRARGCLIGGSDPRKDGLALGY
ncbi:MAG TPA: gamma-glutamyltransferase family protein [Acetobacteraceae bacterium]|nr:gamma-glutamyltransferase family protein [Acetobacteraceae bacterium]